MKSFNLKKNLKSALLITSLVGITISANAKEDMNSLLKKIDSSTAKLSKELQVRESAFRSEKSKQASLLARAKKELAGLEGESRRLATTFETNEKVLVKIEEEQRAAAGNLGEVFGVVRQVAGDLNSQLTNSLISAQYKNRAELIAPISEAKSLPRIKELETLWFELQREMVESGKVTKFTTEIVNASGEKETAEIVRVGSFNLITDSKFLSWLPETKQVVELTRQPSRTHTSTVDDLYESSAGVAGFAVDPSRGAILSLLVQKPSLFEKIGQGGIVGYLILLMFFAALGIFAYRFKFLNTENKLVKQQIENSVINENNSLGRIMQAYETNNGLEEEKLQLKLEEEIMKNIPALDRGIGALKVIATVAPLMGLLGTVTGMIGTFQSITLFGTGDPKLMAGGISQALVTTVLGLICAIPTLMLHKHLADKSDYIKHVLEEKSIGLIALSKGKV